MAAPLDTVDAEVASVGATLALLSAVGVALAALAGWGVARAGLAPVGRLAAVAEQVTAGGNPASRVEVDRADADLEPCVVAGRAQRLQIAVRNLLDNAAKFGPPGAPVEVGMLAGELTVRDPRARNPARRPARRLRPLLPGGVGPGSAGLGPRARHRPPGSRKPRGTVRAEPAPGGGTLILLRLMGPTSRASAA